MLSMNGNYRYIFGNCKNMKEIPDNSVDLVLTGTPAFPSTQLEIPENLDVYKNIFKEIKRILKPTAPIVAVVSNIKMKDGIIFDKRKIFGTLLDNLGFKMRNLRECRSQQFPDLFLINVFSFIVYSVEKPVTKNKMPKEFFNYLWEKPLEKYNEEPLSWYIPWIQYYTNEGDFVVDPFGGGGRVMLSCMRENRSCTCYEINYAWYDKIPFKHIKQVQYIKREDCIVNDMDIKKLITSKIYE